MTLIKEGGRPHTPIYKHRTPDRVPTYEWTEARTPTRGGAFFFQAFAALPVHINQLGCDELTATRPSTSLTDKS